MTYILSFIIFWFLLASFLIYLNKDKAKVIFEQKNKFIEGINQNSKGNNKIFFNKENTKAIAIDELNKKIYIYSLHDKTNCYDFNDIIQSELIIDDQTVTSSNRGSQIVGMAIGGMLAGGIGALIGGLSGGKTTKQEIKNIELKLTINDMNNPNFRINFLSPLTKVGWSKDSVRVKNAFSEIEKWHGYFDIILKQQNNII
jgi:hypothetical protein